MAPGKINSRPDYLCRCLSVWWSIFPFQLQHNRCNAITNHSTSCCPSSTPVDGGLKWDEMRWRTWWDDWGETQNSHSFYSSLPLVVVVIVITWISGVKCNNLLIEEESSKALQQWTIFQLLSGFLKSHSQWIVVVDKQREESHHLHHLQGQLESVQRPTT